MVASWWWWWWGILLFALYMRQSPMPPPGGAWESKCTKLEDPPSQGGHPESDPHGALCPSAFLATLGTKVTCEQLRLRGSHGAPGLTGCQLLVSPPRS